MICADDGTKLTILSAKADQLLWSEVCRFYTLDYTLWALFLPDLTVWPLTLYGFHFKSYKPFWIGTPKRIIQNLLTDKIFFKVRLILGCWKVCLVRPTPACTSSLPHTCYMPRPYHFFHPNHPNNFQWCSSSRSFSQFSHTSSLSGSNPGSVWTTLILYLSRGRNKIRRIVEHSRLSRRYLKNIHLHYTSIIWDLMFFFLRWLKNLYCGDKITCILVPNKTASHFRTKQFP